MTRTKPTAKRRALPWWAWTLIAIVAVLPLILLSPFVAPLALIVLITAIVGISKGSRTWLRLKSRRAALGVTAGAAAVFLVTGGVSAAMLIPTEPGPASVEAVRFAGDAAQTSAPQPRPSTPSATPTPTPVTTVREEAVAEVIAFEKTTYEDASIARGQTAVAVAGQNGERTLTYRITLVDGVETARELVSDAVTVQPVAEATAIGTYDPPPPPPVSNCDPNYADACVPVSSDVDCAWGTGDGPAYLDGVARVVGSDIYGLDRDGDGLACEQD